MCFMMFIIIYFLLLDVCTKGTFIFSTSLFFWGGAFFFFFFVQHKNVSELQTSHSPHHSQDEAAKIPSGNKL